MPAIKCLHGHEQSISTDDWVGTLTLNQLRYARAAMDEKIKTAEALPKRVVWRVCRGSTCEANYREDQFEKAADHLLRIFKGKFMEEAADYIKKPYGTETFRRELPSIEIDRVTQFEYDTEWFPAKTE
ncbi:hypothetical protein D3C84_634170 [compost metagenome]